MDVCTDLEGLGVILGGLGAISRGSWEVLGVGLAGSLGDLGGSWADLARSWGSLGEQGATRQKKARKRRGASRLKEGLWEDLSQPKSIQEGKKSEKRGIKQES